MLKAYTTVIILEMYSTARKVEYGYTHGFGLPHSKYVFDCAVGQPES